ncbi:mannose-1-phosphate guanylyltransferase/mannose-6-phosphate isomerase [Porticoccaceae bacterium]|nr:mannose-1-phosphate guanylyltransferase/mannose-6-phosphate isomerase [Porticoccaceae bacterium]
MLKAVIMAGGSGTRLWPLSRSGHPKQFLTLNGDDTMLQSTVKRLDGLEISSSVTICNEEHRFFVAEQLREIDRLGSIILEPVGKNTAPAIALAALLADDDPLLLVLAADHVIQDEEAFTQAVNKAVPLAEAGKFVTFGIIPKEAHTGYGYIKKGSQEGSGFVVEKFVEKPSIQVAHDYVDSGNYLWNSGMFLFKASHYLKELNKFRPDIYAACLDAAEGVESDLDFLRVSKEVFEKCPSESIDYAVMEQTRDAVLVPMDVGWSDIGSWSSLWDISEKNNDGNVAQGDVLLRNSKNCYVRSDGKLVAILGADDLVVVDTKDALMVAHKDAVQDAKIIAQQLKAVKRSEWELHREVYRPWGKYDSVDNGDGYQVKRITVKPGAKLSVQMHHHRAEHWIVVSGTAKVTNGDKTFLLSENESTYIPVGVIHALENPGKVKLELIEVQSGSYLGEDDIVRFSDIYGR